MMFKRVLVGSTAAAIVALALTQSSAAAHHPEIEITCAESPSTIRITAVAWDTNDPGHRENNSVVVTVNGTTVATDQFTPANGYTFTVDYPVPAGATSAVVRATSTVPWGPEQQFGSAGEWRESTIPLPCTLSQVTSTTAATSTTAPTTTAPTTTAPTTTAPATTAPATTAATATTTIAPEPAVTTTAAPATTVVVEVLGAVEIPRAVVAQPVVTSPRFTG